MISVLSIPKYHSLYNSRVLKVSIQLELIHFHVHNSTMTINFDALEFLICMFSCNNNRISSICVPSLDIEREFAHYLIAEMTTVHSWTVYLV